MENKLKWKTVLRTAGITVMVTAMVFCFAACPPDDNSGNGGGGGGGGTIVPPIYTFTSISEFATWLVAQPANTSATAYNVKLNVGSLGGSSDSLGSAGKALRDNTKYVSLDLSGSTMTSIPQDAFQNCARLTSVTIPNSVISIEQSAFESTYLTSVTIPNSVTSIGRFAFQHCYSVTSVTIPNSVISIGQAAFENCRFTSITIPNSVSRIEQATFSNCVYLASVTIPNSVTSIGNFAFQACSRLTKVTFEGTIASGGFDTYAFSYFGNLVERYLALGTGTYITTTPISDNSVWTKL